MNRTIKFRAWFKPTHKYKCDYYDRYEKELPYLYAVYYTKEDFLDDTWIDTDDFSPIEFEEFTGLKDKNEHEIFEGDILEETIDVDEPIKYRYKVVWDEQFLCWGLVGVEDHNYHLHSDLYEVNRTAEVVGNIHEGVKKDGE